MSAEKDYVILRTYRPVWRIDRKLYSIEGVKLLFPINPNEAMYMAVCIVISILFIKFIPMYNKLHFVIKFGLIPYGLMKFLTKQKLDGKLPHKFFYDLLVYLYNPKKYSRFEAVNNIRNVKFSTPVVYRGTEIKDKTQKALAKAKPNKSRRRE